MRQRIQRKSESLTKTHRRKTNNARIIANARRKQKTTPLAGSGTIAGDVKVKGTRPLDNNEIRLVSACFTGTFEVRNRGLFLLGVSTGGRISELLSLTIGDVYQNEKPVTDLLFDKSVVKGGEVSRAVPVNRDGRTAIEAIIAWHWERYKNTSSDRPLFPSRHKSGTVPLHRQSAHQMLKKAFIAAGLNGKIATHSLRKSFAQRVYEHSGDI